MAKKKNKTRSIQTEQAALTLQLQQMISWSAYAESLKTADVNMMSQFQTTVQKIQRMIWINTIINIFLFLLSTAVIVSGVILVYREREANSNGGIWITVIGLAILISLFFWNPMKSISQSLINFGKVQIVLRGYIQQMNHIDSAYKQSLLSVDDMDASHLFESIQNIQEAVEQSVDEVTRSLEEI